MKAIARNIRISPKKANLIAGLVRRKNAQEALDLLKFTPKKGAKVLYKVLHSAVANAENNFKQKREALTVTEVVVSKASTFKRSVPVSRGRVHPILKRNSHITVTVGIEDKKAEEVVAKAPVKAEAPKKTVKKTTKATTKK